VGARHLLCSSHSFELEIRLHHPHRFLNPDYSVFDCGGVALSEDKLSFSWEGDRSSLGRVVGQPETDPLLPGGRQPDMIAKATGYSSREIIPCEGLAVD
jgi:hypothetical protein